MDDATTTVVPDQQPTNSRRRWLATILLSMLAPGAGEFLSGRAKAPWLQLCLCVALLLCVWPLRLFVTLAGYMIISLSWVSLYCVSAYRAAFLEDGQSMPLRRIWTLFLLPVAFVAGSYVLRPVTIGAGFRVYSIPSGSMEPTILIGDSVVADMHAFKSRQPIRGELVVFNHHNIRLIKRVIAVGGDVVSSKNGTIQVNGDSLHEPYAQHAGDAPEEMNTFGPITVPNGQLFLLGDNRDLSLDSRAGEFGEVHTADAIGKPLFTIHSIHNSSDLGHNLH